MNTAGAPAKNGSKPEDTAVLLHASWGAFVRYCEDLRHGEVERLVIQDGLPVLAEITKKKVKFVK